MSRRGRTQAAVTLPQWWADQLGIDSADAVEAELRARFEGLSRFVLAGDKPRPGEVSAEVATAYGDLWVLAGFLADARRLLTDEEVSR